MKTYEVDVGGKTYEVDAPDPNTAWQWANAHHAQRAAETRAAAQADTDKWAQEIKASPVADMSTWDKVRANVGAGIADLGHGVGQLATDIFGSKEDSAQARREATERRALDKTLANESFKDVPGGKYIASGLQIAGGVVPTLALPAGAFAGAARAIPGLGRLLPRTGLGALATDAAITGAGYGAAAPVEEGGSRVLNMALSAGMGGATPGAAAVLNRGRQMVTQAGGRERAAAMVGDELARATGQAPEQALAEAASRLSGAPRSNIPLTAAAAAMDPHLARIEAGSRARNGANWYDFDQQQAREVSDAVRRATGHAENVDALRALRSSNRETNFAQAMGTVNEGAFLNDMQRFRANLDVAARSPESSNPAVRNMLTSLAEEIDRLGPDFRPEHLATIRANLSAKTPMVPQNAYQAAPRESPATMSVLNEVDNLLNNATNGRWQRVVSGYAQDSNAVRGSQAAGKVRERFWDSTGAVKGRSADPLGQVPIITEAGLRQAINNTAGPTGRVGLSDPALRGLEGALDALRRQGIVQGVKRSATAGGGSNTTSDALAAKAAGALGSMTGGSAGGAAATGMVKGALQLANARRDRALAEALQNPEQMLRLIQQQIDAGRPLTMGQEMFLNAWRASGAAAAQ